MTDKRYNPTVRPGKGTGHANFFSRVDSCENCFVDVTFAPAYFQRQELERMISWLPSHAHGGGPVEILEVIPLLDESAT
jgi:hypothetical protein